MANTYIVTIIIPILQDGYIEVKLSLEAASHQQSCLEVVILQGLHTSREKAVTSFKPAHSSVGLFLEGQF